MTNCRTCETALGLLSEIAASVRALSPDEQAKFRADVLARAGRDQPAPPRP
jgi:hypothetical protein